MGKYFAWDYEEPEEDQGYYHVYNHSDEPIADMFQETPVVIMRISQSPEMDEICKTIVAILDQAVETAKALEGSPVKAPASSAPSRR